MKPPIFGLMGASIDSWNRGVLALGASLVKLTTDVCSKPVLMIGHPNSEPFQFLINGKLEQIEVINHRMSPRSSIREHLLWIVVLSIAYRVFPFRRFRRFLCHINPWINISANAAIIGDIRGGDSFSDIYGLKNFIFSSLPVLTVILVRGNIVMFPQTYGPFKHASARMLARYILRRASLILSRDNEGLLMVRKLIGPTQRVRFCPDVAFALESSRPEPSELSGLIGNVNNSILIGLNINGLMYHGGYTRNNMFGLKMDYGTFLKELIVRLLLVKEYRILMVPHTFAPEGDVESDPHASEAILSTIPAEFRDRIYLISKKYNQHEIKGVIGTCDFFVGSRMHACIAALSQGIPTIGVAYSKKFRGVFESMNAGDWVIDARSTDSSSAVDKILAYIQQRDQMRDLISCMPYKAKKDLLTTFQVIADHHS